MRRLHVALVALAMLGAQHDAPAQDVRATYSSPLGSREFVVHTPAGGAPVRALVVMLHGCAQNADDFARGTRMNAWADGAGFMVLYPEQPSSSHVQKCWNWYAPEHASREQGELGLLAGLIDSVARARGLRAANIAVVGISAGGAMAANLAAHYPDRLAAIAVHSAIASLAASDLGTALKAMREGPDAGSRLSAVVLAAMGSRQRPVPVFALHGSGDKLVSPANLDRIVEQWTAVNGTADPTAKPLVERHLIDGLGHAWSGGSPDGTYTAPGSPDASALIVAFFRRVGVIR